MKLLIPIIAITSMTFGCVSPALEPFKITQANDSLFRSQLVAEIVNMDSRRLSPLKALAPSYRIVDAKIGPYVGLIQNSDNSASVRCVYLDLVSDGSVLGGFFKAGIYVKAFQKPGTDLVLFHNLAGVVQHGAICNSPHESMPFPELVGQIIQRGSGLTF
jgi:hypothetical protein